MTVMCGRRSTKPSPQSGPTQTRRQPRLMLQQQDALAGVSRFGLANAPNDSPEGI